MADALPVRLSGYLIGEMLPGGSFRWTAGWDRIGPLNSPTLARSLPFGGENGPERDSRAPMTSCRYLLEQAQNLLRGDRAWTRALPPALTRLG